MVNGAILNKYSSIIFTKKFLTLGSDILMEKMTSGVCCSVTASSCSAYFHMLYCLLIPLFELEMFQKSQRFLKLAFLIVSNYLQWLYLYLQNLYKLFMLYNLYIFNILQYHIPIMNSKNGEKVYQVSLYELCAYSNAL